MEVTEMTREVIGERRASFITRAGIDECVMCRLCVFSLRMNK